MNNDKNGTKRAADIIIAAIPLIMLIGINTWFATCGPKDDGSFMSCHWAGRMVMAMSVLMIVMAAVRLAAKDNSLKIGLDISLVLSGIITALIPGTIINLCMMEDMICRSATQPWTIALSVILILASAFDITLRYQAMGAEAHSRK